MEKALEQEPSDLIKVVLFGPESTGKSTLSKRLSEHYKEPWVPEFARDYLQEKWDISKRACMPEDIPVIARGQMALENRMAREADQILICDTDLLETKVYSEVYFSGYCDPALKEAVKQHTYDLYLLTYIDIPWEKDDLRDKPDEREQMFEQFRTALERNQRNFIILKGSREQRFETAVNAIDKLVAK